MSLTDWVKILRKEYAVRSKDNKNFNLVLKSIQIEEKIDFKKVEQERQILINELQNSLTKEDIKTLVENSLKKPKKDLVKIKKYLLILDAKGIIESTDEETKQRIIIFQIKKKDYLMLTKKMTEMDVIKPQEIKEIRKEDIIVRLKIS